MRYNSSYNTLFIITYLYNISSDGHDHDFFMPLYISRFLFRSFPDVILIINRLY